MSKEIVDEVTKFYLRHDISSVRPGQSEVMKVRLEDGTQVELNKRLLTWNLWEAYQLCIEHLNELHEKAIITIPVKLGFTKFTLLRPQNVLLAGDGCTHNVCVCAIHQNTKLMLIGE